MNRVYQKEELKPYHLPFRIDSFTGNEQTGYSIEYDGWQFEAMSIKATVNKVLKYIFVGGEE